MQGQLPPAAREMYDEIEDLQDEAKEVRARVGWRETQLEEAEAARDAVDDAEDGATVYRGVGKLRVRSDVESASDHLEERIDWLRSQVADLEATEERLRQQFERRKEDLQHLLADGPGSPEETEE